jgi:anti-anti-sigma factor
MPAASLPSFRNFQVSPTEGFDAAVLPVRASGDLDLAVEKSSRAELRAICRTEGVRCVLLHLGEDVFVDVRGLDVLLDAAASAHRNGRRLLIVAPPQCLVRMICALDLHACLPTATTPLDVAPSMLS